MTKIQQVENLRRLLNKALQAETEEQYEYWKRHFERYLKKLYTQTLKNQTKWEQ